MVILVLITFGMAPAPAADVMPFGTGVAPAADVMASGTEAAPAADIMAVGTIVAPAAEVMPFGNVVAPAADIMPSATVVAPSADTLDSEELLLNLDESSPDYAVVLERLDDLRRRPLDLNTCSIDDLMELPFVSAAEAAAIAAHRTDVGRFETAMNLADVTGLDATTAMRLLPFVTVRPPASGRNRSRVRFDLLQRYTRRLELAEGFRRDSSGYLGGPSVLQTRATVSFGKMSARMTLDKDAGEPMRWSEQMHALGYDFMAGHVEAEDLGWIRRLVIGDFTPRFGHGVLVRSPAALRSAAPSGRGGAASLRPYASATETGHFRGIGIKIAPLEHIALTAFASRRRVDAAIDTTAEDAASAVSRRSNGLHRTAAERLGRGVLQETSFGGALSGTFGPISLSAAFLASAEGPAGGTRLSDDGSVDSTPPTTDGPVDGTPRSVSSPSDGTPPSEERLAGGTLPLEGSAIASPATAPLLRRRVQAVSFSAGGTFGSFYGAAEYVPAVGFSAALELQPGRHSRIGAALRRSFGASYLPTSSMATGSRGMTAARTDLAVYGRHGLSERTRLDYVFEHALLGAPDGRRPFGAVRSAADVVVSHGILPWLTLTVRGTERRTEDAAHCAGIRCLASATRQTLRVQLDYVHSRLLECRLRGEYVRNEESDGAARGAAVASGLLVYEELRIRPSNDFRVSARLAMYAADQQARIYTYENDLLYAFATPSFSGRGRRAYLLVKWTPAEALAVEAKWSRTAQADVRSIGSGRDRIDGGRISEIRMQVRLRL